MFSKLKKFFKKSSYYDRADLSTKDVSHLLIHLKEKNLSIFERNTLVWVIINVLNEKLEKIEKRRPL